VGIKGQLDATDGSLLQNVLFAQHVSGIIMPIIRNSRVYWWLLPVVLGALVYRLSVWCGDVGYVPSLRDPADMFLRDELDKPYSVHGKIVNL
jgi:hypothetical protein